MLIWHYIFFSLTVAFVLGSLYSIAYMKADEIFKYPQVDDLITHKQAVLEGDYSQVTVEKFLGKGGYIEILNQNLKTVYQSDKSKPMGVYTQGEIDCIPTYMGNDYVLIDEYVTTSGKQKLLMTYESAYDEDSKGYVLLDEDLNVITSSKPQSKTKYTERELEYLTGTFSSEYDVWKHPYQDGHTLLIFSPSIRDEDIDRYYTIIRGVNYIYIIFYILMVILFVYWLNRKVKKPLNLLNTAIGSFSNGQKEVIIDYQGPNEFVEICENFNEMSIQLSESEARRQELEQEKQKMLADISHDLKTPITVIQGYSKAICDGLVKEEQLEQYLTTIYHKATGLTQLINNFYEYSKLEHPEFKLNLEKWDVCEYMRAYLAEKYDEVELSGFMLDIDIPDEPLMCEIDPLQLRRVFENIMVNAMKHNPIGTTLYVTIKKQDKDIQIILADDGIGIPTHLVSTLFEPFIVGDDSRNNKQGSGLGLAISKRIIEAHNGSIQLATKPTVPYHTEFRIQMPYLKKP